MKNGLLESRLMWSKSQCMNDMKRSTKIKTKVSCVYRHRLFQYFLCNAAFLACFVFLNYDYINFGITDKVNHRSALQDFY